MSVTMPRIMLLAGLLSLSSLWSNSSWALGLGEIHLNSALNEPLNADIEIIAATPEELTALRATLAPREAFARYGIDRPPFLTSFIFKVGKKDGRDVLTVRSTEAVPEPFVTFLVDVNWARGHLMREYTVLLDPPVYTPGENAGSSAPVTAPSTANNASSPATAPKIPATAPNTAATTAGAATTPSTSSAATSEPAPLPKSAHRSRSRRSSGSSSAPSASSETAPAAAVPSAPAESAPPAESGSEAGGAMPSTVTVAKGDTLTKIAHSLHAESRADVDQTMIALYRANPAAFGGNINVLRQGAVLRVPGGDDIAALNQKEAIGEVHRQMDAWRSATGSGESGGHLRLVSPTAGGSGTAAVAAAGSANSSETEALRDRVKDLEGQLAESKRLIDIRNAELAELQRKAGGPTPAGKNPPPVVQERPLPPPPETKTAPTPPPATATQAPPPEPTPPVTATAPPETVTPPPPKPEAKKPVAATPAASGSWLDWIEDNWQVPLGVLLAIVAALVFVAWRKRKNSSGGSMNDLGSVLDETHVSDMDESAARLSAMRNSRSNESIVVEESGQHPVPDFTAETGRFGDTGELRTVSPEDTMSSESAVNLDQGDPLAEADFHMAYGLYDQAADLVRIALEREPGRRDLRMKLLEIYFVWGNKDAFLQTAKELADTRDQAPAGEWDKIVIMGKQICPGEPLFAASAGSGRGAGALVDLNLEGGENRVDIDLFGDPEGERSSHDETKVNEDTASTNESPQLHSSSDLDFTLDTPDRGSGAAPQREEPTVEAEIASLADAPTTESPVLKTTEMRPPKMPPQRAEQTAEVAIDDLGLHLDHLEETGAPSGDQLSPLEETDHPADAPTMVAGLDERSRRMMEEAAANSRDRDLTELERELEASFIADLDVPQEEIKTAVLPPESAPTVLMPREQNQSNATQRVKPSAEFSDIRDPDKVDIDSTSKLRGINADSIDLDLDRLATALGSGDTVEQPRAAEEVFSNEVFEASQRNRRVDLDVGEAMNGSEHPTNKFQASTNKMKAVELPIVELEPVTMSEVGTKLDLARAYMDMGDPEGARSILEEVVQEGSASQKQEASRLIESLPG
jgi:pilus assembly protein FimV